MNYPYLPRNNYWQREPETPKDYFWIIIIGIVVSLLILGLTKSVRAEVVDLNIISKIESSNNPLAYNRHSQATGLYQITPICLNDYNLVHKTCYEMTDLLSPQFNHRVADWYFNTRIPQMLKAHKLPVNLKTILWAYNAGVGRVKQGIMPKETQQYILKYNKLKARS